MEISDFTTHIEYKPGESSDITNPNVYYNGQCIKYDDLVFRPEQHDPCYHCSNHPRNGGSGVCHCILGSMDRIRY